MVFNPFINPSNATNMVKLKVTPMAAIMVCFNLANISDFAISNVREIFIFPP
jgi:hypothetical protein